MPSFRDTLKRHLPVDLRFFVQPVRDFVMGPGIDSYVLNPIGFERDDSNVPRLNLLLPRLDRANAFGGVLTGVDLFLQLGKQLGKATGADLRVIPEVSVAPDDSVVSPDDAEILSLQDCGNRLPVRSRDLFVVFNWWTSLNLDPVLKAQQEAFGGGARPKLHLVQEYEPHFYPFSSAHMLALQAFNGDWPLWAIFNSSELHHYYMSQGNRADREYPFEPRMNAAIRPFTANLVASEKTRTVLVYGRPHIPRNCFSILQRGLATWANRYGADHRDWRFVSAGEKHRPIALGGEHSLTSVGKLTLEDYGKLLRETAVGVSLMSSPHPSYPPLEMAHFGARVLSNSYANKDLSHRHDNIVSLRDIRAEAVAEALESEIRAFEADPSAGLKAASHMPDYMSDTPFDCLEALTSDIVELWAAG